MIFQRRKVIFTTILVHFLQITPNNCALHSCKWLHSPRIYIYTFVTRILNKLKKVMQMFFSLRLKKNILKRKLWRKLNSHCNFSEINIKMCNLYWKLKRVRWARLFISFGAHNLLNGHVLKGIYLNILFEVKNIFYILWEMSNYVLKWFIFYWSDLIFI